MFERPGQDPEWRLWWVGELHELLGRIYREQGRFADARREFGLGLARREMLFGEAAPRSIEGHVWLALTEQSAGDLEAALKHYRRAAELQVNNRAALEGARLPSVLFYLDALARAVERAAGRSVPRCPPRRSSRCRSRVATRPPRRCGRWRRASAAASRSSRRSRASSRTSPGGAPRSARALAEELTRPAEQREAREEDLKRQLREAEEKAEALETQLQAEFPRYARLTAERPLSAAEVQALLRPDEALVAILPGNQIHVRRGDPARLGPHLPGPDRTRRARHRGQGVAGEPRSHRRQAGAFDLRAGPQPLRDCCSGPSTAGSRGFSTCWWCRPGRCWRFPFGALVTNGAPPTPISTRWAISATASPSACCPRSPPCAICARWPGARRRPSRSSASPTRPSAATARTVAAWPTPPTSAARVSRSIRPCCAACRACASRRTRSRASPPRWGRASDAVVTGAAATERRVRESDLARYRVVAFATHGLLPGELRCQAEPALALSPPATPTKGEDGLLDASEVADAQARRRLGRAVGLQHRGARRHARRREPLGAGARVLLRRGAGRCWCRTGRSPPARRSISRPAMFAAQARDSSIGKAEALRRAQTALRSRAADGAPVLLGAVRPGRRRRRAAVRRRGRWRT